MKRIILSLSLAALLGSVSVSMAETTVTTTRTIEMSKPGTEEARRMGMEGPRRAVLVTIEGPTTKEPRYLNIAGREVEVTGKKVSITLTPEELQRLHEKREIGFGHKNFLKSCQTIKITRGANIPEGLGAEVFIKVGLKQENGMQRPFCESADIKVNKFVGRKP